MDPISYRSKTTGLSVGTHIHPDDGACVMEVVSAAAGERWTDSPTCTHPLLAELARLVNDNLYDQARQRLHGFVPALTASRNEDPATYPRLALACTEFAIGYRSSLWLGHLHRVAAAELRRESRIGFPTSNWSRIARRLYRTGPALHAVEAAVGAVGALPAQRRDVALLELLDLGLRTVRGHSWAIAGPMRGGGRDRLVLTARRSL